ncbi:hypothetical protein [Ralstonia pseudosolanacearum]|nr:hypothetical protein [Ralstonia pseudosolanacearum]MDC6285984.1 hypothetical protein [Ralstonia pseudosolanacearum]
MLVLRDLRAPGRCARHPSSNRRSQTMQREDVTDLIVLQKIKKQLS